MTDETTEAWDASDGGEKGLTAPPHEHVLRHATMTTSRPWQWGFKKVWWLRCNGCPVDKTWGPYDSRHKAQVDREFHLAMWKAKLDMETSRMMSEMRVAIALREQQLARLDRRTAYRRRGGPLTRMARRPPRQWASS